MTPAEKLASKKPRQRAPRNHVPTRRVVWSCQIRELREALRMSIRDTAQAVGMSVSALWQIEMGGDLVLTTARKLAEFFGRTTDELWPAKRKPRRKPAGGD